MGPPNVDSTESQPESHTVEEVPEVRDKNRSTTQNRLNSRLSLPQAWIPAEGPRGYGVGTYLAQLAVEQRVGITVQGAPGIRLYLAREEFEDMVGRLCSQLSSEVREYIWYLTAVHPGAVRSIVDALKNVNSYFPATFCARY
ncbi:hypothetical protein EX30DRAFT_375538 [Ascodesmis nigricans]|uniref:Uncharacterized protein n=1 Tax=Ascodesmis nigricans TaxID=341454 RepID=A0A4S2MHW8_9PEZI|nr:hypothetical protein EX30DRAFT_375538 [Ascodesmis nigricans]